MEISVGIDEPILSQEAIESCSFLESESSQQLVLFWFADINFLMCDIEIPTNDNRFLCLQIGDILLEFCGVELGLVIQSLKVGTSVWEVAVEEVEGFVFEGQAATLERKVVVQGKVLFCLSWKVFGEGEDSRITATYFAEIPILVVIS
jgi:hypothetical protein